ncbi:MAG TPA: PKD domain-containing protein [Thermoanaerobaculia bacterium]|nr:PKD domain-containing protein [Thermoanaerobaculia bacterium]
MKNPCAPAPRLRLPAAFPTLALTCFVLAGILVAGPAAAQPCDRSGCGFATCATPAAPAPSNLWGELQPADASFSQCSAVGPAFCRDSTSFNEFMSAYSAFPWFMSLDSENGFVFAALAYGLQIWDARTTPATPNPLGQLSFSTFPVWVNNPEVKWPLQSVDAPAGIDNVAALAAEAGVGIAVVNLIDKTMPKLAYQSYKKDGEQVYTAALGGREYAFLAASGGDPNGGLFIYDMTTAMSFDHCAEAVPATGEIVHCPGVYQGRLGTRIAALYVSGVDHFVVLSSGSARGFEIWDVANPATPHLQLTGLNSSSVYGVAMWKQGSKYYLGLRNDTDGQIYDVSCIASSCAGGLGSPIASRQLDSGSPNFYVTYSQSGTTPFLYFGSDDKCAGGTQREWLFDVSDPAHPRDVTPLNYWGWYYRGNTTGFNNVMPRTGKFVGGSTYFYRAALSLLDIHKWNQNGSPTPSIFVGGPTSGMPGESLTFTADAAVCIPSTTGWSWTTSGGTISGSANTDTIQVSWPTTGQKNVTATNSQCAGATGLRSINISSGSGGADLFANFKFSPGAPQPGQLVSFDASASTGNPTAYGWTFGDGNLGSGKNVGHSYATADNYIVNLTVSAPGTGPSCTSGICTSKTTRVVVVGGRPAPDANFTTSASCVNMFGFDTCQAQVGHSVTLTATSALAVSYNWNFGDGSTGSGHTVSHTWAKAGSFNVQLVVSNGHDTALQTKQFQITTGPPPCVPGGNHLCLSNNRFQVDVAWRTPQGTSGAGVPVQLTTDTGYFWFFTDTNVEMVVKVLDACSAFHRFWVFAGGLTNVQVDMTVTDTATGASKVYHNHQNTPFQPIQDTGFFNCTGGAAATADFASFLASGAGDAEAAASAATAAADATTSAGALPPTTLSLDNGRYQVQAHWTTSQGQSGDGTAVKLTSDTGYFWFFSPNNVEMVIKVLNACAINQRFWVFAGGLTNVKVDITVTDTHTLTVKHYMNPQVTPFKPIQDTGAFATCP